MRLHQDVDALARGLGALAALARQLPPLADVGISYPIAPPVLGADGVPPGQLGRVLPGRGIALDVDLRDLGLRRAPPGVFGRSLVQRARDLLLDERGVIQTWNDVVAARSGGYSNDAVFQKSSITVSTNNWFSLMSIAGLPGAVTYSAIPGGAALSKLTAGALNYGTTNPPSPKKSYYLGFGITAAQLVGMYILVDVLVGAGPIDCNSNALQTVNSTAITRNYNATQGGAAGLGAMMSFEVTGALGATPANLTVTYTNSGGTGSRSITFALTPSATTSRLLTGAGPFTLLQGSDVGVNSVQSAQLSAAMGAGGSLALNIVYPIAFLPGIAANVYALLDGPTQMVGMRELVQDGSGNIGCLTLYGLAGATTSGLMTGQLLGAHG